MNNAAVNTHVYILLWAYVFISLGCISRSGNTKAFGFFRSFLQMVSSLGPVLESCGGLPGPLTVLPVVGFHFCLGFILPFWILPWAMGCFVCLFGDFLTGCLQVLATLDVDLSLLLRFGAYSGFAVDTWIAHFCFPFLIDSPATIK